MIKKRLIVFGDSMTYGEGLPDVDKIGSTDPSQYAWPAILSQSLDIPVINMALPGVSNKFISDRVLNFDFKKGDYCIVLWTWHSRFHSYKYDPKTPKIGTKIGPWNVKTKKASNTYFEHIYTESDSLDQSFIYTNHVTDYLNSRKIKNIQSLLDYDMRNYNCKFNRVDYYNFDLQYEDKGTDGLHPGPKTHVQIAKKYWIMMKGFIK